MRDSRATLAVPTCRGSRKDGQPCGAKALLEDGYCVLHTPGPGRLDPTELGRAGGLRSTETRREQAKSVRDRLRERVEENVDRIWEAFDSGLVSDDERVRIAAATALLAEAYGKPAIAIGGADRPVTFELVSLLAQARELDDEEPAT